MNTAQCDKERTKGYTGMVGLGLGVLTLMALNMKSCLGEPSSPQPALFKKGKVAVTAPAPQQTPTP
jgi:hypothetical protein